MDGSIPPDVPCVACDAAPPKIIVRSKYYGLLQE